MNDALDAIMRVMQSAFDPTYGEAWNRRQVSDMLIMPGTHFLLTDSRGHDPKTPDAALGFTMSRNVLDEEELLLIAVSKQAREKGIGSALLQRFINDTQSRGIKRLFLEMRDGNPAVSLYERHGFMVVGRRSNYYQSGIDGPFDAITFARMVE